MLRIPLSSRPRQRFAGGCATTHEANWADKPVTAAAATDASAAASRPRETSCGSSAPTRPSSRRPSPSGRRPPRPRPPPRSRPSWLAVTT